MSLPAVLLVVFVVLKLCHVIAWSWWWVTSPVWAILVWSVSMAVWIEVGRARREERDFWERNGGKP